MGAGVRAAQGRIRITFAGYSPPIDIIIHFLPLWKALPQIETSVPLRVKVSWTAPLDGFLKIDVK